MSGRIGPSERARRGRHGSTRFRVAEQTDDHVTEVFAVQVAIRDDPSSTVGDE